MLPPGDEVPSGYYAGMFEVALSWYMWYAGHIYLEVDGPRDMMLANKNIPVTKVVSVYYGVFVWF